MRINRLRTPSPALVVSFIALLVALGGTSYAALALPSNSVGTRQIVNGAVSTKKIRNGAVTASKVNTSGLTVPTALHAIQASAAVDATSASSATHASTADSATMATTASHASTADNATTATTASDANTLGGKPPSTFENAANVKTANVTNNGTTATVVQGNAGAVADRSGTGSVSVFFPENIANCTWVVTERNPLGAGAASIETAFANSVTVLTANGAGALADENFQLLVVC